MFKEEIAEINKMVTELYERPVIAEPVVDIVIPIVEVPNIWAISIDV